ncbi:hypothetical protein CVIRNUC_004411 [Coccomyxa viridis]|uniref:Uncharacterized protein n=1 Tax=Coccomyxa viridis TaxID=1274662 RepID=A0AAV1I326_9CHLO|nr:hypothetical protein CVIRNUC_004411 [Coccomyxa viridis]
MLALKRRLFGAPHDAPKVPEEGPPRHRRKQTDPKRAISLAPERRLPESTPQPASTLSSVPTGSSALSPVSQPPPSGSPDQDVDTPVDEPSTSDPAYVPDESTIDTGSDDSERSITLVSEDAEEGSVSELSEVCVTVHNDSPPCERTPEADVSDLELDIDDPEESCTDHVSAYSTVELTARQRARFTKMLRKPVSYCQPEGGTTTLKKLLNFKIMGEDGLVKYVRTALDHHDCHTCDAMMLLTSFWSRAVPY